MSDPRAEISPYQAVLGDAVDGLHPRLLAYFSAIPEGHFGSGSGVFERVGTPRAWLWPAFWLLKRGGVFHPGWHHDVPFAITNTPGRDADGRPVVRARRRFDFAGGPWSMLDAITAIPSETGPRLVDFLGRKRQIECALTAAVVDGELHMRSSAVAVRIGGLRIPLASWLAPRVSLIERFDDRAQAQHVAVELSAPLLGRLYEYAGTFRYEIRRGDGEQ